MKRRQPPVDVPERLLRFDPNDWPGTPLEAFDSWRAECRSYIKAHPGGALGDPVDQLRAEVAVKLRLHLPRTEGAER